MREDFGVADPDRQGGLDLLAGFRVLTVDVKRPGVGIERVHVMSPRVLLLRYFQSFGGLLGMVGIVEGKFVVGVVLLARFRQRFGFKVGKCPLRFSIASCQLQHFGEVIEVFGTWYGLIALL